MLLERDRVRLKGFNNLTKVVSFNLYDFFVARSDAERESYAHYIDEHFSAARITKMLRGIADIIDAEVLRRLRPGLRSARRELAGADERPGQGPGARGRTSRRARPAAPVMGEASGLT